jgi:hypothetical protein
MNVGSVSPKGMAPSKAASPLLPLPEIILADALSFLKSALDIEATCR